MFGAPSCVAKSIVPAIPVHIFADAIFFTLVWPHHAARLLVMEGARTNGSGSRSHKPSFSQLWAIPAFIWLARITKRVRSVRLASDSIPGPIG